MDYGKRRIGSSGRIADANKDDYVPFTKVHVTLQPDLAERLQKYADNEERAKSWVMQKALDVWLLERGY